MNDKHDLEHTSERILIDNVGRIENYGVDTIPDEQRQSKPMNIFWILVGGSFALSIIVVGWVPVSLGLGWWDSFTSVFVGSAVGATLLAPMSLFGPRTGTNNPVASGAHFGAKGRLIGSILGVAACIVFAALSVWTAGDVLAESAARISVGGESGLLLKIIAYSAVALVMTIIAVLGHANMLVFSKLMVPTSGVLMVIAVFMFWPNFHANYAGGHYVLGSFWPTWLFAAISVAATINSYGPYAGDWTRHISRKKYSDRSMLIATWLGAFFGMGGAFLFGAYTAVTFKHPTASYAIELVANSPYWYLYPLLFIALIAGTAQAVINVYSMGLDFSSIVPRLSRVQATLFLSAISTILVFVGAFLGDLSTLISSFLGILSILGAPWVIVNVLGFFNRKGYYYPDHLQVFNRGETGGRYWFSKGLNLQGTIAWFSGVAVGVFFLNTGWYVSPGAKLLNGADIGMVISSVVGGIVYIFLIYLVPEPDHAFGPEGARFKAADRGEHEPIQKDFTSERNRLILENEQSTFKN